MYIILIEKKNSQVGKFREIIQPFSEATTGGVPEREPFWNNIVESEYKSFQRFVFGIWTCAKLIIFFRIQDVCSATFPQDEYI